MKDIQVRAKRRGLVKRVLTFFVAVATMMVFFQGTTRSAMADDQDASTDITQCLPAPVAPATEKTIITKASVEFTDKDGNTVANDAVDQNTSVKLDYTWAIPNGLKEGCVKSGSTFTFKLPTGVKYVPGSGSLGDYGKYVIAEDGTVTFTFNDKVETEDNVSGTFFYNSSISSSDTPGAQQITIPTTEGPQTTGFVVNPTGGSDISKTGALTGVNASGSNPTGITWNVTVNTSGKQLTNATVTDPMPSSTDKTVTTTLKKVTVYPLTIDLNGNVTGTGDALTEGTDYTVDSQGTVTFVGDYAKTRNAFKIQYDSDIDSSTVPDGTSLAFKNVATLNNDGKEFPADATVYASYASLVTKSYDGPDSKGGQIYNWHIDYNKGEGNLPANTTLVDTLSDGQVFSGTPKLTYTDGSAVDTSDYTISYSANNTVMTVTFPNGLKKAVKLSYQSHVVNAIDDDKSVTISNKATSNGQSSEKSSGYLGQQGLVKNLGDVDYNNKTVGWNFDINEARQSMPNWTLTDTVPSGLTVDYSSFVLKNKDTGVTYVEGKDFKVTPTATGFTVQFIGDLASNADSWYTLAYTTSFDTTKLTKADNNTWTNKASARWGQGGTDSHVNESNKPFRPTTNFVNDGSKSGSYNAISKEITWSVLANYRQGELKGATISDPMPSGQEYVDGSAKLYEVAITKGGGYTLGSNVGTDENLKYDSETKTLTASLPDGSTKAYLLIFRTSFANDVIITANPSGVTNTASYTNADKSADLTATVSVANQGNFVEKSGSQDSKDSAYAVWQMWVNKSQSTLNNAVVTDTPSTNQVFDESSVVIYPGTVSADGKTYTPNTDKALVLGKDYKVDVQTDSTTGQQTFKISFLNQINSAYLVEYRSLINSAKSNDTLTNSASFNADQQQAKQTTESKPVAVVNNGGSAQGQNTNILLTKKDTDTNKALEGASFELWSVSGGAKGMKLRSGTTDADGNINWKNIKSGKYILVETAAPEGYVITDDLAAGKIIDVQYDNADAQGNVDIAEGNQQGKISVVKSDGDTGKPLAGALFDLYKSDGTKIASLPATDAQGTTSYSGLDAGEYYVVETAAPAGYVKDGKQQAFTISGANGKIQQTLDVSNAELTGAVKLSKSDGDTGKALAGAVFDLFKSDGSKVASDLKTGEDGTVSFDGLKPGDYYFVETAAPAGYVFNSSKHWDFTVDLQTTSKVASVKVSNDQKTGSVKLSKSDGDTGKALAGAVFDLFKSDGSKVASDLKTGEDGTVSFDGLKPGDYYFVETAAPAGYVFNSSKHWDFTVDLQTTSKVASVKVSNDQKTGSVKLSKSDGDTGKALAGAVFDLFKSDGSKVASDLKTGEDGTVSFDGLKPGDYYFVETAAPAGFELNDTKLPFTVDLQTESKVASVEATNMELTGAVKLSKSDGDTGKALAGAVFDLFKSDGSKVASDLKTGEDGTVSFDGLKPGDYYFVETAAPAGYKLDGAKLPFTVELQTTKKVASVEASNAELTGAVKLSKSDGDTGKALAGAVFDLFKSDGSKVASDLKTGEDGTVSFDGLKPGDYYFVETAAPAGYKLDGAKLPFTVELQTEPKAASVEAKNFKKPVTPTNGTTTNNSSSDTKPLAKTGSAITGLAWAFGILVVLGLGVYAVRLALSKKKH